MVKIRIVSPSSRPINPYTFNSLMYNVWELGRQGIDIDSPRSYDEYPLSRARNIAMDEFLESDCTHTFLFDDDQIFNKGAILKLLEADRGIVSGYYMSRKGNLGFVVFGRRPGKEILDVDDFSFYYPLSLRELFSRRDSSTSPLATVGGIGLGCMLIKRETIVEIKKKMDDLGFPLFAEWSPLVSKKGHNFGEDLWFSDVCAATGVPIYVHLGVFVGHWAAQGFVIGARHLKARAMEEGFIEFDLGKFK